jgi:hypothetical protein
LKNSKFAMRHFFLLLLLLLRTNCYASQDNKICSDPTIVQLRLSSEHPGSNECFPGQMLYRANGHEEMVDVAYVETNRMSKRFYAAFIRDTKGNIVKFDSDVLLERFAGGVDDLIDKQLNIGHGPDPLYDSILENNGLQLCKIVQMKYPLIGELRKCGYNQYQGKVEYSPGLLKPVEAKDQVCNLIAKETNQECTFNSIAVFRKRFWIDNDQLFYGFTVRRRVSACVEFTYKNSLTTPVEYEYEILEYKVDAQSWDISLIEQRPLHNCESIQYQKKG